MGAALFNPRMLTCAEIRRMNANALAQSAGGQSGFIERMGGMAQSQASAILGGRNKGIGDDLARKIEAAFGKERGWLDHEHAGEAKMPDDVRRLVDELVSQDAALRQVYIDLFWSTKAMLEKRAIIKHEPDRPENIKGKAETTQGTRRPARQKG